MAFVHVKNLRFDPEGGERFYAADAKNDLLAHAHFEIAAVKLGRDAAIFRFVLRDVGVEQVKGDAAHVQFPDLRKDFPVQETDGDEQIAVAAPHFLDRQVMEILVEADGVLDAFLVDLLFEVAVPVEQSDRDEIQIEIAGGLAMIPRENAEAAGVIRDRFVKAELGGEIGDRFFDRAAFAGFSVSVLAREIIAECVMHFLEFAQEILVLRDLLEPGLPGKLQHPDRIVIRAIPELVIEMAEEAAGGRFPRPPEIENHLAQRLERGRERGDHVIGVIGRHGEVRPDKREA